MERMKKIYRYIFIILILPVLFTCNDPNLLLGTLEDEVKLANDLYLEIVSISPENNIKDANPGNTIDIEFDRYIDLSTIEDSIILTDDIGDSFISAAEEKDLLFSFNRSNKILTITPDPYLDGLVNYRLQITDGIKGEDGSILREQLVWNFKTLDIPRGSIVIDEDYTNTTTVNVTLKSESATYYWLSTDPDFSGVADWEIIDESTELGSIDIAAVQGTDTVYVKFRDGLLSDGVYNISSIESDTVVYDSVAPTVDIGSGTWYVNQYNGSTKMTSTSSDATSGVDSWSWQSTSGTQSVVFGSPTASSTTVPLTGEGDAIVRLTVTDKAGNSTLSTTRTVIQDTVSPGVPTITSTTPGNTAPTSDYTIYTNISTGTGGITSYRSKVDSSGWTSFSGSPRTISVTYGNPTIQVQCRDTAGNWSNSATKQFVVYPTKGPYPADGATNVGNVDIAWPFSTKYYYRVYFGTNPLSLKNVTDGLYQTDPYVDLSSGIFSSYTTYYWKYQIYTRNIFGVYTLVSTNPSRGSYSFTTGFLKK